MGAVPASSSSLSSSTSFSSSSWSSAAPSPLCCRGCCGCCCVCRRASSPVPPRAACVWCGETSCRTKQGESRVHRQSFVVWAFYSRLNLNGEECNGGDDDETCCGMDTKLQQQRPCRRFDIFFSWQHKPPSPNRLASEKDHRTRLVGMSFPWLSLRCVQNRRRTSALKCA